MLLFLLVSALAAPTPTPELWAQVHDPHLPRRARVSAVRELASRVETEGDIAIAMMADLQIELDEAVLAEIRAQLARMDLYALLMARIERHPESRAVLLPLFRQIEDPRRVDALLGLLGDPSPEVREQAVLVLGTLGLTEERVLQGIAGRLGDESPRVRLMAVLSLADFGRERTRPWLQAALQTERDERVRSAIEDLL